jgi:hypothetical protein
MNQITCPHCADTYPDFDVAHVCSRGPYAPKLKPRMNNRIQQLAEQALNEYSATYHNEAKIPEAYLKKFAELIVRHCALTAGLMEHQGRTGIGAQLLDNFEIKD